MVPMSTPETRLRGILARYARRIQAADGGEFDRVVEIAPGTSTPSDGGCRGQLHFNVTSLVPAAASRGAGGAACGVAYWTATVVVGLIRCAATPSDNGRPPKPERVEADGQQMLDDMQMIAGVLLASPETASIGSWSPIDVAGDRHGGQWTFTVRLPGLPVPDLATLGG